MRGRRTRFAEQRFCFVLCYNFPNSAWRDLTEEERENFRLLFKSISPWPIITDVRALNAIAVFDRFKQRAKEKPLGGNCPAVVGDDAIKHVVITVDYRDGIDAVKEQFANWLSTEANQKLFDDYDYHNSPIDKRNPDSPTRYKRLLKFLAAWRLYDEFVSTLGPKRGLKTAKEWTKDNRRRSDSPPYHLLPFFDQKLRQTPTGEHYTGPLFKERRQWIGAINKATSFLKREIEYGQLHPA